jgi:hypothetical protein
MLLSFLSRLLSKSPGSKSAASRTYKRAYKRHETGQCAAIIRGQTFPVMNWSFGGIEITAGDDIFKDGQPVALTLKFKLSKTNLEIVHQGVVIRSHGGKTTIRFDPLKHNVMRGLQQVIDDAHARGQENLPR